MPEHARDCTVILLDGTQLKVPVKSSLSVEALLDIASSHAGLKKDENRHFFGLYLRNDGWNNWLDTDKPVLASHHDIPKAPHPLFLHFGVRYYVEDYRQIQNALTLEMYYLQMRKGIFEEDVICTPDDIYNLAACIMQAEFGDLSEEEDVDLDKVECIPPSVLKDQTKETCKTRVLAIYRNMKGLSRAESVIRYLDIAQALGPYGHHLFKVKDKKENVFYIGIGRDGVKLFTAGNRLHHSEKFHWRVLQNVTYKDKKFWFDVSDGTKGSGSGHAYTYYGSSTRQAMNIWQMAKDQHYFFKKRKTMSPYHSAAVDDGVMDQLNQLGRPSGGGGTLVNGLGRISPSGSTNSLSSITSGQSQLSHTSYASSQTSKTTVSAEAHEAARRAQNDSYAAFFTKRAVLMAELEQSIKLYKELQAKEMRITGVRPDGLSDDELKDLSHKVQGNQYRFSKLLLEDSQDETTLLERELELKRAIVEATRRLVDETHNKKLKKDRKKELREQQEKVKELQTKLDKRREASGIYYRSKTSEFHLPTPLMTEGSYDIHAGTLPRQKKKKKTSLPSADDSCIAEMLFDSRVGMNGRLSPKRSTLSIMQSRQLNKSTGALNELSSVNRGTPSSRRSPVPPHHSLITSSSQTQKNKARSLVSLSDHPETSNEPKSPSNSSSYSFQMGEVVDSLPSTSSPVMMAGANQLVRPSGHPQSSLREVNLTDELLSHYTTNSNGGDYPRQGTGQTDSAKNEVNNVPNSRFSPNMSARYSVNGPISRSSILPHPNTPSSNRHLSSPGISEDLPTENRSRTYSYSIATRDHPISSGHNTPTLPHPHIRPANSRVSDSEEPPHVRHGYGHDRYVQNSHSSPKSPRSSSTGSPVTVARSSSMFASRSEHTPRQHHRTQWSPYMDPHSETLELGDPLVNLRGQGNPASEGTYV